MHAIASVKNEQNANTLRLRCHPQHRLQVARLCRMGVCTGIENVPMPTPSVWQKCRLESLEACNPHCLDHTLCFLNSSAPLSTVLVTGIAGPTRVCRCCCCCFPPSVRCRSVGGSECARFEMPAFVFAIDALPRRRL